MRSAYSYITIVSLAFIMIASCKKKVVPTINEEIVQPQVTYPVATSPATSITDSSAVSGGTIPDTTRVFAALGICWDTLPKPTTSSNFSNMFQLTGHTYFCKMNGLKPGKTYYVRAVLGTINNNRSFTEYGNEISFTTLKAQ